MHVHDYRKRMRTNLVILLVKKIGFCESESLQLFYFFVNVASGVAQTVFLIFKPGKTILDNFLGFKSLNLAGTDI